MGTSVGTGMLVGGRVDGGIDEAGCRVADNASGVAVTDGVGAAGSAQVAVAGKVGATPVGGGRAALVRRHPVTPTVAPTRTAHTLQITSTRLRLTALSFTLPSARHSPIFNLRSPLFKHSMPQLARDCQSAGCALLVASTISGMMTV